MVARVVLNGLAEELSGLLVVTGINWIGPDEYQKWIDKSFAEFKGIADEMGWGK